MAPAAAVTPADFLEGLREEWRNAANEGGGAFRGVWGLSWGVHLGFPPGWWVWCPLRCGPGCWLGPPRATRGRCLGMQDFNMWVWTMVNFWAPNQLGGSPLVVKMSWCWARSCISLPYLLSSNEASRIQQPQMHHDKNFDNACARGDIMFDCSLLVCFQ